MAREFINIKPEGDNKFAVANVGVKLREDGMEDSKKPLATATVTFKNGLQVREVALWKTDKDPSGTRVTMPGRSYTDTNENGDPIKRNYSMATFDFKTGQQQAFGDFMRDCYNKALEINQSRGASAAQSQGNEAELENTESAGRGR